MTPILLKMFMACLVAAAAGWLVIALTKYTQSLRKMKREDQLEMEKITNESD